MAPAWPAARPLRGSRGSPHGNIGGTGGSCAMADDSVIASLKSGIGSGETMAMLRRALRSGWRVPDEWKATMPSILHRIASDENASERDRMRAIETLVAMDAKNAEKLVALDKIERIDSGNATEVVVFKPMEF